MDTGDDPSPARDDSDDSPPVGNTGERPSADARVCVVATRPDTFERCRDGAYPAPADYDRTDELFEYMAFYRTAPVSAVTHYAAVTDRVEQRRGESGPLDEPDWRATIDPFSDTERVVVFLLGDLRSLEAPVENDRTGVRGAWYCTVGDLRAATALSDLAARSSD